MTQTKSTMQQLAESTYSDTNARMIREMQAALVADGEKLEALTGEDHGPYFSKSKTFIVAVFMVDKSYGGPEEGGWWYEYGDHVRTMRVFRNEQQAWKFCRRLNDVLDVTLNKGRRSIDSVLSRGRYMADVYEDVVPSHFPEERPYYE